MFNFHASPVKVKALIITLFCVFTVMRQWCIMCDNKVPPRGSGQQCTYYSEIQAVEWHLHRGKQD